MTKNPFADAFKDWGCTANFDWDKAVAAGRQNAKAFGDAAKAATDGLQMIANRQANIFQKQAEEAQKFFSNFSSAKSPESALEQITKAAKASAESSLANSKEIFEVASKSASEATEILSKRLSAAISECNVENFTSPSASENKKKAAA